MFARYIPPLCSNLFQIPLGFLPALHFFLSVNNSFGIRTYEKPGGEQLPSRCRGGACPARPSAPLFSLFCKNRQKLNPSFSISSTLFKKEYSRISFLINGFRTLLQNTGGGAHPSDLSCFNFKLSTFNHFPKRSLPIILPVGCQLSAVDSPVSLFPATLIDSLQLTENSTTLSPVFATLTRLVKHKSFVCHSYKKPGGRGVYC